MIIAIVLFGIAFVCAIIWNVLYPLFLAHLRTYHRSIWEELHCPKYFEPRYRPLAAIMRFLWQRRYLTLSDHHLIALAGGRE